MTKKDILILIIKSFGLYFMLTTVLSGLSNVLFGMQAFEISSIAWAVIETIIIAGIIWQLTLKADKLVDLLKLDKGFSDKRVELGNLTSSDIIKVGVFIIGGLLIVRNLPGLLTQIYWSIRGQELTESDKVNLGISGLNVLIGYLLIKNYDSVVQRLNQSEN